MGIVIEEIGTNFSSVVNRIPEAFFDIICVSSSDRTVILNSKQEDATSNYILLKKTIRVV